jgi:tetratricopeptide (TPR) repeat protein
VTLRPLRTLLLVLASMLPPALSAQEDLFTEALVIHHQVEALQRQRQSALIVYIGAAVDDLILRRAEVRIDEQPPQAYEYGGFEPEALQRGGLHRVLMADVAPGEHRIRVRLFVRRVGARPDSPRFVITLDESFKKHNVPLSLELAVQSDRRGGATMRVLRSDGRSTALHQRVARFAEDARLNWVAAAEGPPVSAIPDPAPPSQNIGLFNAALALFRNGRRQQAIEMLGRIGTSADQTADEQMVRDLANLTLGFQMLRERNGAAANVAFGRVRSPGPYANPALLGLGWAAVLPAGAASRPARKAGKTDKLSAAQADELRRRMPLQYSWSQGVQISERNLRSALVPWNELALRNPFDPVVQEGMLVVAYALQQLGFEEQAKQQYLRAVGRLEQVRQRLDELLPEIEDGRFFELIDEEVDNGWRRWLADFDDDGGEGYMRLLSRNADFIDAAEARRPLVFQKRLLARHAQTLRALPPGDPRVASLLQRIDDLAQRSVAPLDAATARVRDAAIAVLLRTSLSTDAYLVDARFALARIYDPPQARDAGGQP